MITTAPAAPVSLGEPIPDDFLSVEDMAAALPLPSWLSRWAAGPVMRILGLHRINQLHRALREHTDPQAFLEGLLSALRIDVEAGPSDGACIPRTGPVVVVANHPFGGIDGIALASRLTRLRPDVKVLANYLLRRIRPLRDLFIFVNPFDSMSRGCENVVGIRRALQWLGQGGLLLAFPAGEVAHWSARHGRVVDSPWSETVAALARRAGASVVPIHIQGRNSLLFQAAGMLHPLLRTALLPRELMNKTGRTVHIAVGAAIPGQKLTGFATDRELIVALRNRVELLRHRRSAAAVRARASDGLAPIAPPCTGPSELEREVEALPAAQLLLRSGDCSVYEAGAGQIPLLLLEIGRLRERTFRAAGEGTGLSRDLDRFDRTYRHLFIWNRSQREVIGAYRLAAVDELERQGRQPLYTSTLFEYAPEFFERIGPGVELGRSFVRPEWQRGYAPLLLLWKGIGAWLNDRPAIRTLYGAVSISRAYSDASRELICQYLLHRHACPTQARFVRPRRVFIVRAARAAEWSRVAAGLRDLDELSACVSDLEPDRKALPILLKHYLRLGGRAVAFNTDRRFRDAIDVLITLDLSAAAGGLVRRCAPNLEDRRR